MADKTIIQRLLRIEPGISLGQWAYDRVANNWDKFIAVLVGGGGMTYLASITAWVNSYGPVAIGAIGLCSAVGLAIGISYAQSLRAAARLRHSESDAIDKWKQQTDSCNPLDAQFHTRRINLLELKHPVTNRILNKRFIDCELIGPANLFNLGTAIFTNVVFHNCDIVVVKQNTELRNVVAMENCQMFGGAIYNCTIFILPDAVPLFRAMGAPFITFVGDEQQLSAPAPQPAT